MTPPPVTEEAAVAAATSAAGSSIPVTGLSIRLSTYGAESQNSTIVDGATPVWAVLLSGSFDWPSCGPMQWGTSPQPCPPPASTMVVLIDARTGAFVQADMPAPSPPAALPTLEPAIRGGIPLEQAIELARTHSSLTTFVSASAGPFGNLAGGSNIGPSYAITLDQLVWAVAFVGDMTICPPLAAPSGPGTPAPAACWSPRPGQTVVYLDYRTGDFLTAAGYSPPAP